MKRSWKETVIRCVILLVGLVIAHLGVALYLLAQLGADPFNVLIQGLFRTVSGIADHPLVTHGNTHVAVSLLVILVLFFVDRSYVKIGTVLCMVCGGPIIDFFDLILAPAFAVSHPVWLDYLTAVAACVILAFGMTIVIKSDAGTGPNDLIAIVISDKLKKKFSIIRIVTDVSFVAIGWALGGIWGVGTLICAFLVGPVAGFFLPHSEKTVEKILRRF